MDEVQRLGKIVDGLTFLAKADAGLLTLECRPVAFGELVRECYEGAQFLAEPQNVQVGLAECAEIELHADRIGCGSCCSTTVQVCFPLPKKGRPHPKTWPPDQANPGRLRGCGLFEVFHGFGSSHPL